MQTTPLEFQLEVDKLKSSPIFAMSLGSQELFHSNFWAWIGEKYPQFFKVFFPTIDYDAKGLIKREQGHRDITIWTPDGNAAYVIENKLKSMPNKEQLKQYERDLGVGKFVGGVLTGIIKPSFELPNWKYVSYDDICKGVMDIVNSLGEGRDKVILLDYVETLQSIDKVLTKYSDNLGDYFPGWGVAGIEEELNDIKLWGLCQKFQANKFKAKLEKLVEEKLSDRIESIKNLETEKEFKFNFDIYMDFTRGSVYIDAGFMRNWKGDNECAIGIQIQNRQYRKYAKRRGVEKSVEGIFKDFKTYGWFTEKTEILKTTMRNDYCKYEEKAAVPYRFVYQYATIEDYSFEYLSSCFIKDLIAIMEIIEWQQL